MGAIILNGVLSFVTNCAVLFYTFSAGSTCSHAPCSDLSVMPTAGWPFTVALGWGTRSFSFNSLLAAMHQQTFYYDWVVYFIFWLILTFIITSLVRHFDFNG